MFFYGIDVCVVFVRIYYETMIENYKHVKDYSLLLRKEAKINI